MPLFSGVRQTSGNEVSYLRLLCCKAGWQQWVAVRRTRPPTTGCIDSAVWAWPDMQLRSVWAVLRLSSDHS